MAKTVTERSIAFRERMKARGLIQRNMYMTADEVEQVKVLLYKLRQKAKKAQKANPTQGA